MQMQLLIWDYLVDNKLPGKSDHATMNLANLCLKREPAAVIDASVIIGSLF
jgi:hypothetical protein